MNSHNTHCSLVVLRDNRVNKRLNKALKSNKIAWLINKDKVYLYLQGLVSCKIDKKVNTRTNHWILDHFSYRIGSTNLDTILMICLDFGFLIPSKRLEERKRERNTLVQVKILNVIECYQVIGSRCVRTFRCWKWRWK